MAETRDQWQLEVNQLRLHLQDVWLNSNLNLAQCRSVGGRTCHESTTCPKCPQGPPVTPKDHRLEPRACLAVGGYWLLAMKSWPKHQRQRQRQNSLGCSDHY